MKTASVLALFTASSLLCAPAWAQLGGGSVGKGEFPGLQLLPPGSVVKGISLPRYENHRVTAMLRAAEMTVVTRSDLQLKGLTAELYSPSGETTSITTTQVDYSFSTEMAQSKMQTQVTDPRFTARGSGVTFCTARNQGLLRGPVRTTIPAATAQGKRKEAQR